MSTASPVAAHFEAPVAARASTFSILTRSHALFSSIVEAVGLANQKRAHREIGRFIARNGGLMTDSVERQIGNRFSGG